MGKPGRRIDVTQSEMMELRKQGYSNRDIGKMLEISHKTVRKYIGKQGCRMESLKAFDDKPVKHLSPQEKMLREATRLEPYAPKLKLEEYKINGDIGITIDYDLSLMKINASDGEIFITYDDARELVRFLAWASREKCTEVNNNECTTS